MKILDALLKLQEQASKDCVDNPDYGICYNLAVITEESDLSYDFVKDNCCEWEFFSGLFEYPVELSDECDLWEGKQLELRLSLLNHLIAKARQEGV